MWSWLFHPNEINKPSRRAHLKLKHGFNTVCERNIFPTFPPAAQKSFISSPKPEAGTAGSTQGHEVGMPHYRLQSRRKQIQNTLESRRGFGSDMYTG